MGGGAYPNERRTAAKRIMFGNLEGAVRRVRVGKEKEPTGCVQSDIRLFGIAGHWKATALEAEVWVESITEGGRRLMAAWGKVEADVASGISRRRERQRDWEREVVIAHESVEFCEAAPIGLADESKESLHERETDRDLRSA